VSDSNDSTIFAGVYLLSIGCGCCRAVADGSLPPQN
jgi:hypothetical protein